MRRFLIVLFACAIVAATPPASRADQDQSRSSTIRIVDAPVPQPPPQTPPNFDLGSPSEPSAPSQTTAARKPPTEPYKEDYDCAHELQDALKKGDKAAVAHLIEYPFERPKPLQPIKTEKEFIESWSDFFNSQTINYILQSEPGEVGWRGVALGSIWFRKGKIHRIGDRTDIYKKHFDAAKKKDYATLYPSARGYKQLRYECDTPSHHIRIQQHQDGVYYFSWKKGAPLSQRPELKLKGFAKYEGTTGWVLYTFKNGKFVYQIDDPGISMAENCDSTLILSKNGDEISNQVCKKC